MNASRLKALCHQLGDEFGHAQCARWAGVSPSVWSDYCNYQKPDTTIPGHRMFLWEGAAKRRDFSRLFADNLNADAVDAADPRKSASDALTALAKTISNLQLALADDELTLGERNGLLEDVADLSLKTHDIGVSIASLPVGRHLRVVA